MMATKTAERTLTARGAARALGVSAPTVLSMLEHGELPGKLVDGRWEIPAAAVRAKADAALDAHHALSQQLGAGAAGAAWLEEQWTRSMLDALAAEILTARELVSAYADLKVQRDRKAAPVVARERLENLDAVLGRHHAAVATVESLRELRAWIEAARASRRVESSVGSGELASFMSSGISVQPSTTA